MIMGIYEQLADWFFTLPDIRTEIETAISERFELFLESIDQIAFSADILTTLMWSMVGAFLFMVIWFLINIISDIKNNVKVSVSFKHPDSFHQSSFCGAVALRLFFKSAVIIFLLSAAVLFITNFLPVIFTATQLVWNDTELLARIVGLLGIWSIVLFILHVFVVFLRLLFSHSDEYVK
jgi:hypothetical protein